MKLVKFPSKIILSYGYYNQVSTVNFARECYYEPWYRYSTETAALFGSLIKRYGKYLKINKTFTEISGLENVENIFNLFDNIDISQNNEFCRITTGLFLSKISKEFYKDDFNDIEKKVNLLSHSIELVDVAIKIHRFLNNNENIQQEVIKILILLGDMFFAKGSEALARLKIPKCVEIISKGIMDISHSQVLSKGVIKPLFEEDDWVAYKNSHDFSILTYAVLALEEILSTLNKPRLVNMNRSILCLTDLILKKSYLVKENLELVHYFKTSPTELGSQSQKYIEEICKIDTEINELYRYSEDFHSFKKFNIS